jgi:hypothetical protein
LIAPHIYGKASFNLDELHQRHDSVFYSTGTGKLQKQFYYRNRYARRLCASPINEGGVIFALSLRFIGCGGRAEGHDQGLPLVLHGNLYVATGRAAYRLNMGRKRGATQSARRCQNQWTGASSSFNRIKPLAVAGHVITVSVLRDWMLLFVNTVNNCEVKFSVPWYGILSAYQWANESVITS